MDETISITKMFTFPTGSSFHTPNMPCCWFYNSLHSTVTSFNIHARVQPHKFYRHRQFCNWCTACKRFNLQTTEPYQIPRCSLRQRLLHFVFSRCVAVHSTLHYTLLILRSISINDSSHIKTTVIVEFWKHTIPFRDKN